MAPLEPPSSSDQEDTSLSDSSLGDSSLGDSAADRLLREVAHAPDRTPEKPPAERLGPDGRYVVGRMLGRGGMGTVYAATDTVLRREVALKVLPDDRSSDPERRRRFLREARAAAAITHANIAAVYDVGEAEGRLFIAMELVAGVNLRAHMAPGLSHGEAVRIGKEIARGVAAAHAKGVVHRDLKPENVMITPDGEVKILDFGLAKLVDEQGGGDVSAHASTASELSHGRVMGTVAYMSPEQASGRAVDTRSDVFSFAVVLYEMLTGVLPFDGKTYVAILEAVKQREPVPVEAVNPDVSAAVASVVGRCLQKPAEKRPTAKELVSALDAAAVTGLKDSSGKGLPADGVATVSGMGTALGATLPGLPPELSSGEAIARGSPRWRRGGVAGFTLVCIAAIVGFVTLRGWREKERPATASSIPASSASSLGIPITDHPLPASNNSEALLHYAEALSRFRVGAFGSRAELGRAVVLDPTLAQAQLRLALCGFDWGLSASDRQRRLAAARALASSLDSRDHALLRLAELVASDPIDRQAALSRGREVAAQYPLDAEVAMWIWMLLSDGRHPDEALAQGRHVLELDPLATQVTKAEAAGAFRAGNLESAFTLIESCISHSPTATHCRFLQVQILGQTGKCDAALAAAHELVRVEPEHPFAADALAQALVGAHASNESVAGAVRAAELADANALSTAHQPAGFRQVWLAVIEGDFARADDLLAGIVSSIPLSSRESAHALPVALRIALAEEMGQPRKALELANDFTERISLWTPDVPTEVRLKRVYLQHESGAIGEPEFRSARDRLFDEQWKASGIASAEGDRYRWFRELYYSRTAAEAKEALSLSSSLDLQPSELREHADDVSFSLVRAGRFAEAIPYLKFLTRQCSGSIAFALALATPLHNLVYQRAHVYLGQALEAQADLNSACAEYAAVERDWRDAKPRSVTLEMARARSAAIHCSSRPTSPSVGAIAPASPGPKPTASSVPRGSASVPRATGGPVPQVDRSTVPTESLYDSE